MSTRKTEDFHGVVETERVVLGERGGKERVVPLGKEKGGRDRQRCSEKQLGERRNWMYLHWGKKGDQKDVWIERREYKRRLKAGQGGGKGEGGGNCRRCEREIWKQGRR